MQAPVRRKMLWKQQLKKLEGSITRWAGDTSHCTSIMQQYLPHQILGIQKEGKHVTCAKCFISGPVRLQRDRHVYRKLARSRHKRDEAGADPSRPGPHPAVRDMAAAPGRHRGAPPRGTGCHHRAGGHKMALGGAAPGCARCPVGAWSWRGAFLS